VRGERVREAAEGEMKLNVKTLKGTSFEIEASPEETVRPPSSRAPL